MSRARDLEEEPVSALQRSNQADGMDKMVRTDDSDLLHIVPKGEAGISC